MKYNKYINDKWNECIMISDWQLEDLTYNETVNKMTKIFYEKVKHLITIEQAKKYVQDNIQDDK